MVSDAFPVNPKLAPDAALQYQMRIYNIDLEWCEYCDGFVYLQDHHCFIMNNCVAFLNMKPFLSTLINTAMTLSYIGVVKLSWVVLVYQEYERIPIENFDWILALIFGLMSFLIVVICIITFWNVV